MERQLDSFRLRKVWWTQIYNVTGHPQNRCTSLKNEPFPSIFPKSIFFSVFLRFYQKESISCGLPFCIVRVDPLRSWHFLTHQLSTVSKRSLSMAFCWGPSWGDFWLRDRRGWKALMEISGIKMEILWKPSGQGVCWRITPFFYSKNPAFSCFLWTFNREVSQKKHPIPPPILPTLAFHSAMVPSVMLSPPSSGVGTSTWRRVVSLSF